MSKRASILLTLLLALSVSPAVFASSPIEEEKSSDEEKTSSVQAKIRTIGHLIPVTPLPTSGKQVPSPSSSPTTKVKRTISLSLKSKVTKAGDSSSSSSPRSTSPKKLDDTLQSLSSSPSRLRGFSYTSGSSSPRSTSPEQSEHQDEIASSSAQSSPEISEKDSPKRARSKSSSKKDFVLSAPAPKTAFVTIKNPEEEFIGLLQTALTLCGTVLEPLNGIKQDSNNKVELVVKPMLADLKSSIQNIITKKEQSALILDPKQRVQELGDPVSFFRMTVNRAMTQIPSAVKWALEQPSENPEMIKYFEKMLEDAKKSEEIIISEHNKTKLTLMELSQELYLSLVTKAEAQKSQQINGRTSVVDAYLKEYVTYMNGMDDQLKQVIGKPVSFNSLNREFNPTILLMKANILKILDWAVGKEEGIDEGLLEQLSRKLKELTTASSSSETTN